MKFSLSLENLFNTKQNAFLGINQALPMFNRGKKIVISRGLSFYLYPQYYKEDYKRLKKQLDQYIKIADHIVVSSERVKNELEQINNKIIDKVIILPFGIPFHLKYTDNRHIKKKKYFLYVGSDQKIKNLDFTIKVFKKLKKINQFKDYKLVLIGVKDKNLASEGIECIPHLFGKKLIKYYQEATAYISSSYYESFNQPVIEALSQSCPVVALEQSIIPEQKPFVHNVKNQEEMIAEIKSLAIHNRNKIDYNKFEQTFSWKKFVKKLKLLYN
jgi:glycosyltransferase involved in cell wall biosynthesis